MEEIQETRLNRHILLAVDDSPNSRRAVEYVAYLLGAGEGFHVILLHVVADPEEDYFAEEAQKESWLKQYRERMTAHLDGYRRMLLDAGFDPGAVEIRMPQLYCPSMADCILTERDHCRCGTIVVGRQGLSRKEEFLFGSVSSKIVKHARRCTVWVVE
jgi:nucleotide-binding universal stress UspA family protein